MPETKRVDEVYMNKRDYFSGSPIFFFIRVYRFGPQLSFLLGYYSNFCFRVDVIAGYIDALNVRAIDLLSRTFACLSIVTGHE